MTFQPNLVEGNYHIKIVISYLHWWGDHSAIAGYLDTKTIDSDNIHLLISLNISSLHSEKWSVQFYNYRGSQNQIGSYYSKDFQNHKLNPVIKKNR